MKKRYLFINTLIFLTLVLMMMELTAIFFNKYYMLSLSSVLILLMIILLIFLGILTVYFYYKRQIMPLDAIAEVAKAVKNGNLSKRVAIVNARGKVEQLGININKMIESLQDRESCILEYQQEIHRQKEYFEALFNSLADGVIVINTNCDITGINPIVSMWIGLREEEIIGRKLSDFVKCQCTVSCINNPDISDICPLISRNERLLPQEAQIENVKTNMVKTLGLTCSQVSEFVTNPTYVIVFRDITETKEMNSLRDDFIATLTHDLRVPILAEATTLKFFSKGMFGEINSKQKEAIDNMIESNDGLLSLVNSLLDTYKYDSDCAELFKENVNIRKLVEDCISEVMPLACKNHHEITNKISEDFPLLFVDKNEIKRVFVNLINNAVVYTPKGGHIIVDASIDNNMAIMNVSDNGRGIVESELKIIFERFFSKAKKFRKVGTGLGLYLSKQIIEKHNGKIWAESELGQGSTFYFSLPLEKDNN